MNALVAIALYDKHERDRIVAEEMEKEKYIREIREIGLYPILTDVCSVFGYDILKVKSKRRAAGLVLCKRLYCYLSCLKTKFSLSEIANEVGFDDHTTVIYHRDVVKKLTTEQDPEFIANWRYYLHNSKLFTEIDFQ
jgi:chromosomal replication initiation ATPase DnaA